MARSGEDDFGSVYADVRMQDVGTLRGFGSLNWVCEDESDPSADRQLADFHAANELCHNSTRAHRKSVSFDQQEEANSMFNCFNGVSLAQNASNQDCLTEVANSQYLSSNQDCLTEVVNSQRGLRDTGGAKDIETDSDDDLDIVLNPLKGVTNEGSAEDSEDAEDFVILAGNEATNNQEWQVSACLGLDDKVQAHFEGGGKLGIVGDEKAQIGSSPVVQPRIGYGRQAYHRQYRYVRGSNYARVGTSVSSRMVYSNGKPNRFCGGRGSINYQRSSLPSRRTGAFRGLSCGLEYSIPSNKTVYDVDIDALSEKPWRLPHVNVADYFNFGFDEISWKKYCKELAQFCLDFTTQSKIRVYEGGRLGQSIADATQVGDFELWSPANIHGQLVRESDAIFLVDMKADGLSQSCTEGHSMNSGDVKICLQHHNPKSDVELGNERVVQKKAQSAVQDVYQIGSMNLGAGSQKCCAGLGDKMQVNKSDEICLGEEWTSPSPSRLKTLSPSTPPERIPKQDKREMWRGKSQSSSLNDGLQFSHEENESGAFDNKDNVKRRDAVHCVKASGRHSSSAAVKYHKDNGLNRRMGTKKETCHTISSRLSKTRRLSSHTVNHGTYRSIQVVKSSCRRHALNSVFRACKVCPKGDATQIKKHMILNIEVEHAKKGKPVGQSVEGPDEHNIAEIAESKVNSLSLRTQIKKSKGQGGADSSQIKDGVQGLHYLIIGGNILKDEPVGQYMDVVQEHRIVDKAERKIHSHSSRRESKKSKGQDENYSSQVKDQLQHIHCVNRGVEVKKDKPAGLFVDELNEHHNAEKSERKANCFLSSKKEKEKAKVQDEIDSSQIKDQLQGINCEQLKKDLKARKVKKGRKSKKRTKSKGCTNIERRLMTCGSKIRGIAATGALNDSNYIGFGTREKVPNVCTDGFVMSRLQEIHSPAEDALHEQRIVVDATVSEPSQEEVDHRGRSKFERWTSHSEQVRHDSCLSLSEKQNIGRVCLSRKVSAGKVWQCSKQLDEPGCAYMRPGGEDCGAQPMAGAMKERLKSRTTCNEEDKTSSEKGDKRSCQQHLDQFAAKLEKRWERFNLSVEAFRPLHMDGEREPSGRSLIKSPPIADRVIANLDRPTRKRCWGGG